MAKVAPQGVTRDSNDMLTTLQLYQEFPQPLAVFKFTATNMKNVALATTLTFVVTFIGLTLLVASEQSPEAQYPFVHGMLMMAPITTGVMAVGQWRSYASYGFYRRYTMIGTALSVAVFFLGFAAFPALEAINGNPGVIIIFSVGLPCSIIAIDGVFIGTALKSNQEFTKSIGPALGVSWAGTAILFVMYSYIVSAMDGFALQGAVAGLMLTLMTWLYEKLLIKFYLKMYLSNVYLKNVATVERRLWTKEEQERDRDDEQAVETADRAEQGLAKPKVPIPTMKRGRSVMAMALSKDTRKILIDPTQTEIEDAKALGYLPEREAFNPEEDIPDSLVPPLGDMEMVLSFNILCTLALSQAARLAPLVSVALTGNYYLSLTMSSCVTGLISNLGGRLGWQAHVIKSIVAKTAFTKALDEGRFFMGYPRFLAVMCVGLVKCVMVTGDPWDILLGKEGAAVILTTFAFYVLEDILAAILLTIPAILPPPAEPPKDVNPNHPDNSEGIYSQFREPEFFVHMGVAGFSFTMVIFACILQIGFDILFGFCPAHDLYNTGRGNLWWWPRGSEHHPIC